VNLIFAASHPALTGLMPLLPDAVRSLVISLVLFVLPAAGWFAVFGPAPRTLGMRLARTLIISTAVLLGSLALILTSGATLTTDLAWTLIWALTNLGFAAAAFGGRPSLSRRVLLRGEIAIGLVCFLSGYGLFFWGATRVVPPQVDQDLEVMATGFGLLTRFEPLLLTDRHSVYFFAHPPLLHFYVAGSCLLSGSLDSLKIYDDGSRRVRDAWEGRAFTPVTAPIHLHGKPIPLAVEPGTYRIVRTEGLDYLLQSANGDIVQASIESVELDQIYAQYATHPLLVDVRTPNVFFAACTVALLAIWVGRISHRWWLGPLAAVAYATSPEVFVRSSYGGYFAVGCLSSMLILLSADHWRRSARRGRSWLAAALGAFAALVDHKSVLLPAALGLRALVVRPLREARSAMTRLHPVGAGFVIGTLLFWLWGFSIARDAFVADHFRNHLLDRITHDNPFGYEGYPSVIELWREFTAHTGYLLLPFGLSLLLWDLWSNRKRAFRRSRPDRGCWMLWMAFTGVAFSVIDWRMTKHLMPLVLPLCLGVIPDRDARVWRIALPALVLLVVATVNLAVLSDLVRDFESFVVTPAW